MLNNNINTLGFTEREIEIMTFIHEFGFCEMSHIIERFKLGRSTAYDVIKILRRLEMVKSLEVLVKYPRIYFLTTKAVQTINSNLPPIKRIARNTYLHHLEVLNVYLKIKKNYPDGKWLTERVLRGMQDTDEREKVHLPDGMLILDKKKIAIEVELSLKEKDRLLNIFSDYHIDKDIDEVWYFCEKKILPSLEIIAKDFSKIKLHSI